MNPIKLKEPTQAQIAAINISVAMIQREKKVDQGLLMVELTQFWVPKLSDHDTTDWTADKLMAALDSLLQLVQSAAEVARDPKP